MKTPRCHRKRKLWHNPVEKAVGQIKDNWNEDSEIIRALEDLNDVAIEGIDHWPSESSRHVVHEPVAGKAGGLMYICCVGSTMPLT